MGENASCPEELPSEDNLLFFKNPHLVFFGYYSRRFEYKTEEKITTLKHSARLQYNMEEKDAPQLYDLVFPPGTPRSIIRDIINTFDVELIDSPERLNFANMEGDVRNLIAARGKKEIMVEVEAFFKEKIKEFIQT